MTVKNQAESAAAKSKRAGRRGVAVGPDESRAAADGPGPGAMLLYEPSDEDHLETGGMFETASGVAGSFRRAAGSGRDKTKEKAINAAYRRSPTLRRTQISLRPRWSILKEERLATVFGSYVCGDDVFKIDLPAIVNVDEWLERAAARALAMAENDTAQIETHEQQIAWIESQMAGYPTYSIFGIICKLMIWRRRNKDLLASNSDGADPHRLALAAYADLIRLTGFHSVACCEDYEDGVL